MDLYKGQGEWHGGATGFFMLRICFEETFLRSYGYFIKGNSHCICWIRVFNILSPLFMIC
jgi:hypothetical protein